MKKRGHFDSLNIRGEYFISHEKSRLVVQKEDVW